VREKKKMLLTSLFNFKLYQQILFHYNIFRDIHAIINEALQEQLLASSNSVCKHAELIFCLLKSF